MAWWRRELQRWPIQIIDDLPGDKLKPVGFESITGLTSITGSAGSTSTTSSLAPAKMENKSNYLAKMIARCFPKLGKKEKMSIKF